jgi:hypothetical protein
MIDIDYMTTVERSHDYAIFKFVCLQIFDFKRLNLYLIYHLAYRFKDIISHQLCVLVNSVHFANVCVIPKRFA